MNAPTDATIVSVCGVSWNKRGRPRHHVDARRNHGGRMDQGGDRCGAFHGVGKPDVQRKLRRFAGGADEQQQRDRAQRLRTRGLGVKLAAAQHLIDVHEAHGADHAEHQQHTQDEAGVAHAVDDECFLPGVAGGFLVEVETDEQIAAQAHAFPSDEQQRVVVRQHQHQHEEHEQVQVAEEAIVAVVVRHVAGGVDVDQKTDAGDDQDHHGAERVEQESPVGA